MLTALVLLSGGPAGIKLPDMPPTKITATEWWVRGIGKVKETTTTDGQISTTKLNLYPVINN